MLELAQKWFDLYITTRGTELRQSSRTVYGAGWKQYTDYLQENRLTLTSAGSEQVRTFLETYTNANTAIRYFRLLSAIYEAAENHDLCNHNPLTALSDDYQREEDRVPVSTVSAEAVEKLYSIKPGTAWKKHRDRVLVLLTAEAGLRRSELLTLRTSQLRLENIPPRVSLDKTLTAENREVHLSARLTTELQAWLALRTKSGLAGTLAFPANSEGDALNPSTVYRIIEKHLEQVGVGKAAMGMSGSRVLRASLAQRTKASGAKLSELQKVLGHRQLMSTADLVDRTQPFQREKGSDT